MTRARGDGTIYHRADGRWEASLYRQTASGTRKRVHKLASKRQTAADWLAQQLVDARHELPVADQPWKLGAYLDYWLGIVKRTKRPSTYRNYESACRLYLKPGLGSKRVSSLTIRGLQQFFQAQLASGATVRTVQKQRTALSAALTRAMKEELIVRNPARSVELPRWERREISPWSLDELAQFIAAARPDPLYAALLAVACYGLRSGEVRGLQWRDLDLAEQRLHIRRQVQRYDGELRLGPVKTSAGARVLPLLSVVRHALLARLTPTSASDDLIFQTQFGNPIECGNLLRSFQRISRSVGLRVITLHQLRHTAATLLKNLGVPARDAQLILGHADIRTTQQLYQHADLGGQARALERLEASLLAGARRFSRQDEPSNSYEHMLHGVWQTKTPASTGVIVGGSSQTRTGDTRLFSGRSDIDPRGLTEVALLARQRQFLTLLGAAAVMFSRQVTEDEAGADTASTKAST